ncbi:hypothetical protein KHA80_20880 [Anaerobacillus sp. HL2]|nr:hypothetical protein KHA80_20880 [Anaerobacillus sp. HL2]
MMIYIFSNLLFPTYKPNKKKTEKTKGTVITKLNKIIGTSSAKRKDKISAKLPLW